MSNPLKIEEATGNGADRTSTTHVSPVARDQRARTEPIARVQFIGGLSRNCSTRKRRFSDESLCCCPRIAPPVLIARSELATIARRGSRLLFTSDDFFLAKMPF